MAHINRKRGDTRMQIIRAGAKHFIGDGYTKTTMKKISQELDLSPGNITFYFPTKDHLLAVLVKELFNFQNLMVEKTTDYEKDPLFIYCMEFVSMVALCSENEVARDFYVSAYTSPYTLELIRKNDVTNSKSVFNSWCNNYTDSDWMATEIVVSGIKYGALMFSNQQTELCFVIEKALDSILNLYKVPQDIRVSYINRVLSINYIALGKRILDEFRKYLDKTNEIAEI